MKTSGISFTRVLTLTLSKRVSSMEFREKTLPRLRMISKRREQFTRQLLKEINKWKCVVVCQCSLGMRKTTTEEDSNKDSHLIVIAKAIVTNLLDVLELVKTYFRTQT